MSYDVIRHAAISGPGSVYKFNRVLKDGNAWACEVVNSRKDKQYLWIDPSLYNKSQSTDSMFTMFKGLANNAGVNIPDDELWKCVNSFLRVAPQHVHQDNRSFVRHSDNDDPDILTDDDVEIIEAPYPENGKAQIPRRSFIYDDEDGYPQDYFEHHGILGMKWGVRRYQNPDGSLTDAGRKHYGRNYTVRQLKKNIQDPNLSYSEKKALVSANKVNRMTKTKYRDAATSVATGVTGVVGAGTLAGLMAAGVLSVNPLLPVAALAGGVVSSKAINAGRNFLNAFRDLRVEMIDRAVDKQRSEKKPTLMVAKAGELPESTRVTGKEEEEFWKAYAKQVAPKEKTSSSDRPAASSPRLMSNIPNDPKAPGTFEQRRSAYISEHKSELLKNAKDKGTFDMEFLESNGDTDKYGAPLEGKELMAAYEKYLDDEIKRGK